MALRSVGWSFGASDARVDVTKPCSRQILRRTAASVSEKVWCCLRYQALVATAWRAWDVSCFLIATIGKYSAKKGKHAEQGSQDQHAAIAVLNVSRMDHGVQQQAYRVDEDMPLLA